MDMALQATLEELEKKNDESDLLIAKRRLVVDLEKEKVGDAKFELNCIANKHAKDVEVIQEQVTKLIDKVAQLRSTNEKVIEEFKYSEEFKAFRSAYLD
ncbi:hypothetical protein GBA52_015101 [Prunus armeniaca]|nr:hypothetical protein GBA52_015101 [Prunus armeniaca]